MKPWIELRCALSFDQGIKLSGKVPFVAIEQPVEEFPSFQVQTKDSHISYSRLTKNSMFTSQLKPIFDKKVQKNRCPKFK